MKSKKKFNKLCLTEFFKKKQQVVQYMLDNFERVEGFKDGKFEKSGYVKDKVRGAYFRIYLGRKVKGIGKGKVNRLAINYSERHHPEFKGMHLEASAIRNLYFGEAK